MIVVRYIAVYKGRDCEIEIPDLTSKEIDRDMLLRLQSIGQANLMEHPEHWVPFGEELEPSIIVLPQTKDFYYEGR